MKELWKRIKYCWIILRWGTPLVEARPGYTIDKVNFYRVEVVIDENCDPSKITNCFASRTGGIRVPNSYIVKDCITHNTDRGNGFQWPIKE